MESFSGSDSEEEEEEEGFFDLSFLEGLDFRVLVSLRFLVFSEVAMVLSVCALVRAEGKGIEWCRVRAIPTGASVARRRQLKC